MSILSVFQNIRTLRIKFLTIILPPVIICFLIFSIVLAFLTYRDMKKELDTKMRNIADLQSAALVLPLWNYLDENVKQTLENLLMNPDIIKAVVRDTKGRVIARAGKADDKGIYKGEVQIEREITFMNTNAGKKVIGSLSITFHQGRIYQILYGQFIRDSLLLLLLVIAIVGSALAANKLAIETPLNRLLRAIRKADDEDVREIVHWPARDELGQVIKAYNSLIESLKVAEKSLKEHSEHMEEMVEALSESEDRFRYLVETTSDWIWEVDQNSIYTYVSPKVKDLLGYELEEVIGKTLFDLMPADEAERVGGLFRDLVDSREPFKDLENTNLHKDGHHVVLETSGVPIFDKAGNLTGFRGIDRDITERKQVEEEQEKHREQLEEVVRERTAELENRVSEVEQLNSAMVNLMEDLRVSNESLKTTTHHLANANKELEAFSYSISHDLRAPLRSVDGFSQILLEDYSDTLDEKGKHYLERARAGTQKMGQLIDDILNLSRIGRQAMKKKGISMESIAREVYNSLEDEWKERKVDFNVHKCPTAAADLNLINIVFMNLLSNALKFTGNRKEAKIEVGSETKDEQTVFFVKDNGVGFDMKYTDKLFTPFQRLHRVEEYEGTGIGLAIVQRIIHRHGGRIWVESEVDVGTTFYFTV
ncbi:MAG: PAS domain S-box protein [Deltaproteobacteria bacterium]|nr:PAS domain S-box protein [Deltaproteobacteria bacterium]